MADATLSPQLDVYIGPWTNWSRGRILGATLTVSQSSGGLLIAFVALFVAYTGTCAFRLACFAFHRYFTTDTPQDAIYHQRQAILRNSANGVTAIGELCKVLWNWRQKNAGLVRRILPLAIYIAFSMIAFGIAGVFSSNIAGMSGSEVLLKRSLSCGVYVYVEGKGPASLETWTNKVNPAMTQQGISVFNYGQDCYMASATEGRCNLFIKPQLESLVRYDASCPFDNSICKTQDGNIVLDSGWLDSHVDLGINAPESSRVFINNISGLSTSAYYYGPQLQQGSSVSNYTYLDQKLPINRGIKRNAEYGLHFEPITPLQRTDADVMLIFLSADGITYTHPVDDAWYSAHTLDDLQLSILNGIRAEVYLADNAASPLGCTQQYSTCVSDPATKSRSNKCTLLGGEPADIDHLIPDASKEQQEAVRWVWFVISMTATLSALIKSLRTSALMSKYTLYQGLQGALPDNQWQLDVEGWHNATMAAFQSGFVEAATGFREGLRADMDLSHDAQSDYTCENQKIRSTAYANFSIFGLCFIFITGGRIITASHALESSLIHSLTHRLFYRKGKLQYHRLEWYTNGTLQLQRLAHEELGFGVWSNCGSEMPVTESSAELLATLDLRDPEHPRLNGNAVAKTVVQKLDAGGSDTQVGASMPGDNTELLQSTTQEAGSPATGTEDGHDDNTVETRI